jgi:hypothetical protein
MNRSTPNVYRQMLGDQSSSFSIPRYLPFAVAFLVATTLIAIAAEPKSDISNEFEKCRMLGDNQARLACLKSLLPKTTNATNDSAGHPSDLWRLVRTPHPQGGPDAVSIMHTANTARSDPELAGLMIRCTDKAALETVLALVKPVPPRSKRDVILVGGTTQVALQAEAASVGTTLVLPIEPSIFTTGAWRTAKELAVTIQDPDGDIRGIIPIDGISPAMATLSENCPRG